MAGLSISTAWDETADILKRDFGALFSIALAFIALPNFAVQALGAGPLAAMGPGGAALLLPLLLVAVFLSLAGELAIAALALGRERVVKPALIHGLRRGPAMLGAALILVLAAAIVFTPVLIGAGVSAQELASPTPETLKRLAGLMLLFALVFVVIGVRLQLMLPAATAEPIGPIAILARSWRLTRGHFWKLLGFNLLVILAYVVVMIAAGAVFGLVILAVAGRPEPGSLSWLLIQLVNAAIAAAFSVVITTILARIYAQLAGSAEVPSAGPSGIPPTSGS
jgi:hypothetical protein